MGKIKSPKSITLEQKAKQRLITNILFFKGKGKFHGANAFYNALVKWNILPKEKEFVFGEVLLIDPQLLKDEGLLSPYVHDKFLKRTRRIYPFLFEENVRRKYPMLLEIKD